jgi:hypothetical protein
LELQNAVLLCPPELERSEHKAVQMLQEEVEKRSQIRWQQITEWPTSAVVVAIGPASKLQQFAGPFFSQLQLAGADAPEGYRLILRKTHDQTAVFIIGNDPRGVLFGAGRLLRELHITRGSVRIDDNTEISTARNIVCAVISLGTAQNAIPMTPGILPVWEQYYPRFSCVRLQFNRVDSSAF